MTLVMGNDQELWEKQIKTKYATLSASTVYQSINVQKQDETYFDKYHNVDNPPSKL